MPRHAAFTIVQDDPFNLKIWVDYYRRTYRRQDLYVLHHPTAGEVSDPDWIMDIVVPPSGAGEVTCQLVPVFRDESFNHIWLRETVQSFQHFLLQSYDTVLFAEVDEVVVPVDAAMGPVDFRRYLDDFHRSRAPVARCTGYEVVHDYAVEPPLDPGFPLLRQRSRWYRSSQYSKPLLSKVCLTWTNGFHELAASMGHDPQSSDRLLLLHLHKLDFGRALERHRRSAARAWAREDRETNQGLQNRVADEAWLRNWWYDTVDRPGERAVLRPIPISLKDLF